MDYVGHFEREAGAFEAAARRAASAAAAPDVPSCPEWVVTDLMLHLGMVHRLVARVVGERMPEPPDRGHLSWLGPAEEYAGQRPVTGRLGVRGDASLLERYFVLVPPI